MKTNEEGITVLCNLCPRRCNALRTETEGNGFCRMPATPVAARAALHQWEEPPISGTRGSGTVFFSGCSLRCVFCQNEKISHRDFGKPLTLDRLRAACQSLVDQGVFESADRFLEICRTGEGIAEDYPFIQDVVDANDEGRAYVLEGYLYPDTYEIYVGSSEETVIGRMLDRMNVIYGVAYRTRAEELGMDMDEVITLASMIEREGKADSFDKVSAVFHNRLDAGMALGSDVTVQYALGVRRLVLTQEELAVDSAYNTYQHTGLPVGAICNPGNAAIEAALYPDSDYVEEGYLYFVLTDPETGELAFTKTLEEHDAIVEEYRPLWEAYDQASEQGTNE